MIAFMFVFCFAFGFGHKGHQVHLKIFTIVFITNCLERTRLRANGIYSAKNGLERV